MDNKQHLPGFENHAETTPNHAAGEACRPRLRGNTGPNHANQENRLFSRDHTAQRPLAEITPAPRSNHQPSGVHGASILPGLGGLGGLEQQRRPLGQTTLENQPGLTGRLPGLHQPNRHRGSAEPSKADVTATPLPNAPAPGSLVARLVAAGATVRTWSVGRGGQASIEAPAGIPADLLREVEARGWRIIPGGRANPEAEHDSWLVGVPIVDLER